MNLVNIEELKRKIHSKIEKCRSLSDQVASEKREFSTDEKFQYNKLMAEIDDDKRDIRTEEAKQQKEMNTQAGGGSLPEQETEIRFLNHNNSFAQAIKGNDLPDGIRPDEINTGRMIRGLVTGKWNGAEAEKRALVGQEDPAGGYWLPGGLSGQWIDLARANMVTSSAGAITIPVEADSLKIPKIASDPTVTWRGELAEIDEGDPSFEAITLQPKVCACLIKISQELYEDGAGVGDAVRSVMTRAIGQEMDRVVLMGGAAGNTNEPVGVYFTDGVTENEMGTDGADLTSYNPFIDAIEDIEAANGTASAVIYSPRTKADLATLVTGITSDLTKLTPPEDFKNLRKLVTTSIGNDLEWGSSGAVCSAAFLGGFSNVWVGMRNQIRLDISPHGTGVFNRLALWVRAYVRMDVALVRPNQLVRITGITTSR